MKNILLFTLLLCCVTLRSQTYSIYPIPQKTTMNGNSIEMTREVNLIKEPGINEMISNRIQEVLTNAGINFTISDVFTDDKTNILIGINGSKGTADNYTSDHSLSKDVFTVTSNKFDPYLLQINKNQNSAICDHLSENIFNFSYSSFVLSGVLSLTTIVLSSVSITTYSLHAL